MALVGALPAAELYIMFMPTQIKAQKAPAPQQEANGKVLFTVMFSHTTADIPAAEVNSALVS